MNKQKGFTLIEVLIALAIISILAAVALPAWQDYTKIKGCIARLVKADSANIIKRNSDDIYNFCKAEVNDVKYVPVPKVLSPLEKEVISLVKQLDKAMAEIKTLKSQASLLKQQKNDDLSKAQNDMGALKQQRLKAQDEADKYKAAIVKAQKDIQKLLKQQTVATPPTGG
ncbi:MAG: prepilin-type N-terminal cleavage/methylation domain-containing protein [Alphaproteobacteria bacterium]|jgi:prepilin-type N-terminal cleavage/methylation domain-containing protein